MALFHYYLLIFALCTLYVESANPIAQHCKKFSNTTTPKLTKVIESIVTKLAQDTPQTGYNESNFEDEESKVMGIAQCRADVPHQECSTCIQTAAKEIIKFCPNRSSAMLWYDYCLLRYGIDDFLADDDKLFKEVSYNVEYVTNPKTFRKTLMGLVEGIQKVVGKPDSKGFGKGEIKLSDSVTLYAFAHCTRDQSNGSCSGCINSAMETFRGLCENKKGCRVIYGTCYVRYELYDIFFPH